jgi:chemotaxis protein methyltransferase CheR
VQFRTAAPNAIAGFAAPAGAAGEAADVLGEREFTLARRLIAEYAGIKLSPHKRNMVYNRLVRRLRARGLDSFADYLALVQAAGSDEREAFVNALTTNLTAFFREPHHFELLRARAQTHAAGPGRSRPMRIWSAGCSTGEEAWSMAMVLREAACPAEVLGTDIDTEVLKTASAGVYRSERADGLERTVLRDHFLRGTGSNEGWVTLRPELRGMLKFMPLNLQAPVWPALEPFDAIFCRNVSIYFDRDGQKKLLSRFAALLRAGALLAVGHSESFPASDPGFRSCGRTAYERTAG